MIPGVDRSHLNSKTSLVSLKAQGLGFVWLKATQGLTYVDPTFNASWQEAKATAGLIRGCYHFFDPRVDGIEQAKHYLSQKVSFSAAGCLPCCVDVEDLVGSDDAETAQANKWVADNWQLAVNRLTDFLNYVKQETTRDCVIYTYNNYPKEYFHGHGFPDNPMWLSSLQTNPPKRYDTGKLPEFWQNSYRYKNTDQDGDFFTGTQSQLQAMANLS
jgi:lysozyme